MGWLTKIRGLLFCWHHWGYSHSEVIGGMRVAVHRCPRCQRTHRMPYYQVRPNTWETYEQDGL